jgi:hypothetical protein
MAYLSMLVAKGIFETVTLSFLMVGHTHEDIDALFSKVSEASHRCSSSTLPGIMTLFENCVSKDARASLVTEVPDFKGFVNGYAEVLTGHTRPLQFLFTLRGDGVPIFQYKLRPSESRWIPEEGVPVFNTTEDGKPNLPEGNPKPVPPFQQLQELKNIVDGLGKYVKFLKSGMPKDPNQVTGYSKKNQPVIQYWETVIAELEKPPTMQMESLQHPFWPRSRWQNSLETDAGNPARAQEDYEEEVQPIYVGPLKEKPKPAFNGCKDAKEGMMVLVRPDDPAIQYWLGRVDQVKRSNVGNVEHVSVSWYKPRGKAGVPDRELYENCLEKTWVENRQDPPCWIPANTILYAWKAQGKNIKVKKAARDFFAKEL